MEAQHAVTNNGSGANLSVTEGLWTSQTFTPESGAHCKGTTPPTGNLPCNAVEVTATSNLARLFSHGTSTLSRTAVAADTPEAAFSIGSYLASMGSPSQQTSVLGVLLGKLGASANLTAVGYAGLANTFVSVQQLINASGGILTPTNVMSATLERGPVGLLLERRRLVTGCVAHVREHADSLPLCRHVGPQTVRPVRWPTLFDVVAALPDRLDRRLQLRIATLPGRALHRHQRVADPDHGIRAGERCRWSRRHRGARPHRYPRDTRYQRCSTSPLRRFIHLSSPMGLSAPRRPRVRLAPPWP